MSYPTKYTRQYDFQGYQVSNPTRPLPGNQVNIDLNAVKQSVGEIVDFLKGPIRADGQLANGSVGVDQLNPNLNLGFSLPTTWESGVDYTIDSTVLHANKFWKANVAHTSTDGFDESKWTEIVDFGAQATAAAASAASTAADRIQTALDRVATTADAAATASDRVATTADAAATAGDRAQTGADAVATAADRVQTGLDAIAAGVSAANAAAYISNYASRAAAMAASPPAPMTFLRTAGFYTKGDGGDALYERVVALGTNQIGFQSADGAWWQMVATKFVVDKACGVKGDGASDDAALLQLAINLCLNGARPVPLKITSMCKVDSALIVNRAVGGAHGADTFRIIGEGPFAGFTTSAAIAIVDTTLPYVGGTNPSSCNIRFESITFLGPATDIATCVSDKFVKVHFESCRFNAIRCTVASFYLQSWRWHNCSMIAWPGIFVSNTETYYDCHWNGCDFESGVDGIKSFNGGFDGSSITNCLFENSGRFFSQAIGLGTTIIGNYTERNSAPDYQLSDVSIGGYHRGTLFAGNFMAGHTHALHNVIVGDCQGMLAGGNYTDAKLYDTTNTTAGSFKSLGDYAGTSKFSTAGSFDLNHAGDYIEGSLTSASATALTTGTAKTIVSIVLQPGDWDVSGVVGYVPAGSTSSTRYSSSISLVNNTGGVEGTANINVFPAFVSGGFAVNYPTPVVRVSVAVATTVYLVAFADFTVSTMAAFGKIRARKAGGQ